MRRDGAESYQSYPRMNSAAGRPSHCVIRMTRGNPIAGPVARLVSMPLLESGQLARDLPPGEAALAPRFV